MEACPSEFALDDEEAHGPPGGGTIARHVDGCARCQTRRAARARDAAQFQSAFAGPLRQRLAVAAEAPPPRRRWSWSLAFSLAGTAAIAILAGGFAGKGPARWAQMSGPSSPYTGVKGKPWSVVFLGRRGGSSFFVEPGSVMRPGDELEVWPNRALTSGARYVVIGSVDGTGRYSPFYPSKLDEPSLPLAPGAPRIGPPIVLDDAPGPERVVIVYSAKPLEARVIAAHAEAAASREVDFGPALGPDVTVYWTTIQKQKRAP